VTHTSGAPKAPARGGGLRLGYACVNTQLPSAARTVRLANATAQRLRELIAGNLDALEEIMRWNIEHDIEVFRITSGLIPFGSHPANDLVWCEEFADRFDRVGALGGRLSTHPGQYTVLSSARPEVVANAVAELEYHDRLLSALGLDSAHKIVIHVGSTERFEAAFQTLSEDVRSRLVLENDEQAPLAEILPLAERLRVPVVFDVFHHRLAPSFAGVPTRELVLMVAETWRASDGPQKIHFSTQAPGKRRGAHAETIDLEAFDELVDEVGDLPLDCMLELKDKEQSVLRAKEILGSAILRSSPRSSVDRAAVS
jgi:UV DNA damage endonuclease